MLLLFYFIKQVFFKLQNASLTSFTNLLNTNNNKFLNSFYSSVKVPFKFIKFNLKNVLIKNLILYNLDAIEF